MDQQLPQHIELSRLAYFHNIRTFRALCPPPCRLMAVVKANAYGHGLLPVSRLAVEAGVDYLGVNCLEEGVALRQDGIRLPGIILGYTMRAGLATAAALELEPVLYDLASLERLQQEAARQHRIAAFHLKLETGVHRQGLMSEDLPGFVAALKSSGNLRLAGAGMHFANIEDTTAHSFARSQLEAFRASLDRLAREDIVPPFVHTACSAAAILFPETHFGLARVGIGSYGLWPSKETFLSSVLLKQSPPVLQPVATWKTRIAQLKTVEADRYIGYGCAYRTTHRIRMAVLPVGYYDGYDRELSNQGRVLVRGRPAPVIGRICMNMTMIDVTHIPEAEPEDEVVLLGRQGDERISAEEIAAVCHTINYEIVSRLGSHIPRICV